MNASNADRARVAELLGREPGGAFEVVVRNDAGDPVVLRNAPILDSGRPMPTLYWLVGEHERRVVGRMESDRGVRESEAAVDPAELAAAHRRYAEEREAEIPPEHVGPRPSAGVGGTRQGVKCLHAHYAYHLAAGDDPIGRWVAERFEHYENQPDPAPGSEAAGPAMTTVAAIDIGTNSTRLLVHDGTRTLTRRMTITRLGQDVDATGRLSEEAVDRVLACLTEFKDVMDSHGVTKVRAAATSAARDADNREEFFDAVQAVIGARPELLSGMEEGKLSFRGATADLDPDDGPFLVVDIGGGSTEFVYGATEAEATMSLDIGCVRLTEKYVEHDPPLAEELVLCLSMTEAHLDDVLREMPQLHQARTVIGLAGTISTAASVEIGLVEYDREQLHHFTLTKDAAEDVYRTLVTESREDRLHNPGLDEARADVIVGGMCVLVQVMRSLGFEQILVSEADILDGLAASLLD